MKQTIVQQRTQNHRKPENERKSEKERETERKEKKAPEFSVNACLNDLHYNYLYLYIDLTVTT